MMLVVYKYSLQSQDVKRPLRTAMLAARVCNSWHLTVETYILKYI